MGNKFMQLLAGVAAMLSVATLAEEPSERPLVVIEGYGEGPLRFTIGESSAIRVRYREDIDSRRVRALVNDRLDSKLLNPIAGEEEIVDLYLRSGESLLVIEASSENHPRDEGPEARYEFRITKTLAPPRYGDQSDGDGFF